MATPQVILSQSLRLCYEHLEFFECILGIDFYDFIAVELNIKIIEKC